jgi:hypothetical protein
MATSSVAPNTLEARLTEIQRTIQGTAWFLQTTIEDHEGRKGNSLVGALYFAIDRLKELGADIPRLISDASPATGSSLGT